MKRVVKALFAAALLLSSSRARATRCDALPNASHPYGGAPPPVVYIEGSTAAAPFIVALQQALSVDASPINLVYVGDGSCVADSRFFGNQPISNSPQPTYYAAQTAGKCDLPTTPDGGVSAPVADIAVSDVYAQSCGILPGGQIPSNVGNFLGPIQPMLIVVPRTSTQQSISATAAYFVFGFGDASGVSPWTHNGSIYRRNPSSGTQALISVAAGVPLTQWAGADATTLSVNSGATPPITGTAAVVNALETDPKPEQAIGIMSATSLDKNTATLITPLAFKDNGQSCGYFADSTATAHDKRNVIDGHYSLWGPIHFYTYVDVHGDPQNQSVGRIIQFLTGTAASPAGVDLVQLAAINNLVPPCAMRVSRTVEMGPLASYAPAGSCSCYFEYAATGQSGCTPCVKHSDCPTSAPVCNTSLPKAFCETQ